MQLAAQRTQEWYDQRLGKFTASEVWKLMSDPRTKAPGKLSATAETYVMDKIAEILTGMAIEAYGKAIEWGVEWEPYARMDYEVLKGVQVEEVGFVEYSPVFGGSPDGLVGKEGMVEFKCPESQTNHAKNLLWVSASDVLDCNPEHYYQCQGNMLATGRKWCDLVSFHPRMLNESLKRKVIRIERDENLLIDMADRISKAGEIMNQRLKAITGF